MTRVDYMRQNRERYSEIAISDWRRN